MPEATFVIAPCQSADAFSLVGALRHELAQLGVETSLTTSGFPDPQAGRVFVLVSPHQFFALEGDHTAPASRAFARTILICGEESDQFEENVRFASGAGAVFDTSRRSVRAFKRQGIRAEHLGLGYTTHWDHYRDSEEREVDVALLGAYTQRRGGALGDYADALWRHRCELRLYEAAPTSSPDSPSIVSDEAKWALLGRAKALLNLHRSDQAEFEWLRVVEAMHAGCAVVSEAAPDYEPLLPGEHLLMGRRETLGLLVQELIEDPSALAQIRSGAYEFLRRELPMSEGVARFAAVVEEVAQKPAAGRGTTAAVLAERRSRAWPTQPPPPASTTNHDASVIRAALKETRLALIELRRDVAGLRQEVRAGAPVVPRLEAATWGFQQRPPPRVSVLTALYNASRHIVTALESVRRNIFKDLEIVIVDDGSTDDSAQRVIDWMAAHPHVAAALVSHPVNRGSAHARNTALRYARGERALILDADNELLPNCVERLDDALDGDGRAAFSYGILAAVTVYGSRQLLSQFDWEPRRLARENYIDALALVEIAVLREVGGFATHPHLAEDWDLWATMADLGYRGVFVPELVARYGISEGSRGSLARLSTTVRYGTMIERHPELMRGIDPPL